MAGANAFSYRRLSSTLNDPLNEVFAAYVKEEIAGAFVSQTKGAFSGYLKSIVVKSGWRGKHLGRIMMGYIEKKIFANHTNVFLCVSSFNLDGQKFYSKLGYQVIGVLKDYLVEGYDEILMRKTTGPIHEKNRSTDSR